MPAPRATILIIDDDAMIRALTVEVLCDAGYAAVAVADHAARRRALAQSPYDLILADTVGPASPDPWPTLDGIRDAAGGAPVLIFSARAPTTLAGHAERGFAGLVAKPFDVDELVAVVRDTLSVPSPRTVEGYHHRSPPSSAATG